jgi:hypothetical protein
LDSVGQEYVSSPGESSPTQRGKRIISLSEMLLQRIESKTVDSQIRSTAQRRFAYQLTANLVEQ